MRLAILIVGALLMCAMFVACEEEAAGGPGETESGTTAAEEPASATAAGEEQAAEPTPAPPEPTATPEPPIIFEGSGDDVVLLEPTTLRIARISGNAEAAHFSVWANTPAGDHVELLVNTTEPYEGIVPIDLTSEPRVGALEVSAAGPWRIEVLPLSSARFIEGASSGTGDEVVFVGGEPRTAFIRGNASAAHFAIWAYGERTDLLVNTTDPYEGRVQLRGPIVFAISAVGAWEITLE